MKNEFGWYLLSALGFFVIAFLRTAIEVVESIFSEADEND